MGVFYHCPGPFATIGLNLHADRSEKIFIFFSIPTTTV
jgi:hypothetical protein